MVDDEPRDDLSDQPPRVMVFAHGVLMIGPGAGSLALTPEAAVRLAESLLAAAKQAAGEGGD